MASSAAKLDLAKAIREAIENAIVVGMDADEVEETILDWVSGSAIKKAHAAVESDDDFPWMKSARLANPCVDNPLS